MLPVLLLQWSRAQDPACPWDEKTCFTAVSNSQLEVLQWLRSQEPPCPWEVAMIIARAHSLQISAEHRKPNPPNFKVRELCQWLLQQPEVKELKGVSPAMLETTTCIREKMAAGVVSRSSAGSQQL